MPFIGQDWRQPGELWVRTTEGWERFELWRLKFLENLNENVAERRFKLMSADDCNDFSRQGQPHAFIVKGTRERKMRTSLSEAFNRLDLTGAVKNRRRFNYVANLLELLIKNKFSELSGCGQRMVLSLLAEMLLHAVKSESNVRVLHQLLKETRAALKRGQYWHMGSAALWQSHHLALDKMQNTLNTFQYKPREDDGGLTLSDLPDDCVRHILRRMAHHQDIVHTGLTQMRALDLAKESQLWRSLCMFHFDDAQINVLMKKQEDPDVIQWQKLYKRLVKRFGMRDVFVEELHMCKQCNAVFWSSLGHPCLCPDLPPRSMSISPAEFLQLLDV